MTKLKACAIGILLFIFSSSCFAQSQKLPINEPEYNKPQLFADLPSKMNFKIGGMEIRFNLPVGEIVSIQISDSFVFQGTVVSKSDTQDANTKSVVIRSSNRPGATFTFTKTTSVNGSMAYMGRI